jgi:hypothetical protein
MKILILIFLFLISIDCNIIECKNKPGEFHTLVSGDTKGEECSCENKM